MKSWTSDRPRDRQPSLPARDPMNSASCWRSFLYAAIVFAEDPFSTARKTKNSSRLLRMEEASELRSLPGELTAIFYCYLLPLSSGSPHYFAGYFEISRRQCRSSGERVIIFLVTNFPTRLAAVWRANNIIRPVHYSEGRRGAPRGPHPRTRGYQAPR